MARILLVNDEPDLLQMCKIVLERAYFGCCGNRQRRRKSRS